MSEILIPVLNSNIKKSQLAYKDISLSCNGSPSRYMSASADTLVQIVAAGMMSTGAQGSGSEKRVNANINFSYSGTTVSIHRYGEQWSHDTAIGISATIRVWYYA